MTYKLLAASFIGIAAVQEVLPPTVVQSILEALCALVVKDPTVVEVSCIPQVHSTVAGAQTSNLVRCNDRWNQQQQMLL